MNTITRSLLLTTLTLGAALPSRSQSVIYQENLEGTTGTALPSGWTVVTGKFGESAANPLQAGIDTSGRVLTFSAPTSDFDTFSAPFDLSAYKGSGQQVVMSFDFLSAATTNHAGVIGLRYSVPINANPADPANAGPPYIAGSPPAAMATSFIGTGAWQTVTIDLGDYINNQTFAQLQTTHIFFELWAGNAGQVASGTPVYFDNLTVEAIPEPSTYAAMAGLGVFGFTWVRRRIRIKRLSICS